MPRPRKAPSRAAMPAAAAPRARRAVVVPRAAHPAQGRNPLSVGQKAGGRGASQHGTSARPAVPPAPVPGKPAAGLVISPREVESLRASLVTLAGFLGLSVVRLPRKARRRSAARVPARAWESYPLSCRQRAEKRRRVLAEYFNLLRAGATIGAALLGARKLALELFHRTQCCRHLNRWISKVKATGTAFESLPPQFFIDGKSTPHPRARKAQPPATPKP